MSNDPARRGEGYVFQKPGSRFFHAQWYVDGARHRGSTGQVEQAAAEAWLRDKLARIHHGDEAPREDRVTLADLWRLLEANYELRKNRSIKTIPYVWKHLTDFFGEKARVVKLAHRLDAYVGHRRAEGAADATIRYELSLLDRAYTLAVTKRLISPRSRPTIEKPAEDPSRIRTGFLTREDVERLCTPCDCPEGTRRGKSDDGRPRCWHLSEVVADMVRFLFFSAWRVNEVRSLEWRDYFAQDGLIRLRPELSKNKRDRMLPVDVGELAAILERRQAARRQHPECPHIFHRNGAKIGDFRKAWAAACAAVGLTGRIVHDLRRSGVKHLMAATGDRQHIVMEFSGHRTPSMLRRYNIIGHDDLRAAAEQASEYQGAPSRVATIGGQPQNSLTSPQMATSTGRRS